MRIKTNTNGTEEELPLNYLEETDGLGEPYDGRIATYRSDVQASDIEKSVTEVEVKIDDDVIFAGRLNDIEYDGNRAWLICDSWEMDANDAKIAKGANASGSVFESKYEDEDSQTIFEDTINEVNTLDIGSISDDADQNENTIIFSNTPQDKKLRQLERGDPFFLIYNYDQSVDYVKDPGSERTEQEELLRPDSKHVEGTITVSREGFDDGYTSILLLGAGPGGQDQIKEEVNLQTPNSKREKQKRVKMKDVYSKDRLKEIRKIVKDSLTNDLIDVKLRIRDLEVDIGDEFPVLKPSENLFAAVNEEKRKIKTDDDGNFLPNAQGLYVVDYERRFSGSEYYDVTLSSRRKYRDDIIKDVFKDLESYSTAKEPPVTMVNGSARSIVDASNPLKTTQVVPEDVIHERRSEIHLRALPYRSPTQSLDQPDPSSGGSVSNGLTDFTINAGDHKTLASSNNIGSDHNYIRARGQINNTQGADNNPRFQVFLQTRSGGGWNDRDQTAFRFGGGSTGSNTFATVQWSLFTDARNLDVDDVRIRITSTTDFGFKNNSPPEQQRTKIIWGYENPDHSVSPEPGIIDTGEYPGQVDLTVDGGNVNDTITDIGASAGAWEETINLTEEFTDSITSGSRLTEITVDADGLGVMEMSFIGRYAVENTL